MAGELLNDKDYDILQRMDIDNAGALAQVLNRNGMARWTVCPKCHVDDFTHVEKCALEVSPFES